MIPLPEDIALRIEHAEATVLQVADLHDGYATSNAAHLYTEATAFAGPAEMRALWGIKLRVDHRPPRSLALLAAQALASIREPLDYLANALVKSGGGTPASGGGGTSFPILLSRPSAGLGVRGGIDPEALKVLEGMQPYRFAYPERTALANLHGLHNRNKHRALVTSLVNTGIPTTYACVEKSLRYAMLVPSWRGHVDEEWAVDPIFPTPAGEAIVAEAEGLRFGVSLSEARTAWPLTVVQLLDHLLRVVRDIVIPAFRPFFSDPWPEDVFLDAEVADAYHDLRSAIANTNMTVEQTEALCNRLESRGLPQEKVLVMQIGQGLSFDPRLEAAFAVNSPLSL